MAFVSLFYSFHRPGIELSLSRIPRLHSLFNESDTVTHRWETHLLTTAILHAQSRNRSSRIAHSRMGGSWKVRLFTFPIFSMSRTRNGGRVIQQYPNLSLGWFSILLHITIRFIVYLKQGLSSVPFSAHISLFWEFFFLDPSHLATWVRDILEELIVAPIIKKLPPLYGTLQDLERLWCCCDPDESSP